LSSEDLIKVSSTKRWLWDEKTTAAGEITNIDTVLLGLTWMDHLSYDHDGSEMADLSTGIAQNLFDGFHAQGDLKAMPDVCDPGI